MGIDIYMNWLGQTEEEKKAQYTGFSITSGCVGYLREAYHGGPYVTKYLVQEAFDEEGEAKISAEVLRKRLPAAVMLSILRSHLVYGAGKTPGIINVDDEDSDDLEKMLMAVFDKEKGKLLHSAATNAEQESAMNAIFAMDDEQMRAVDAMIHKRHLPDYALSFVDFVELAKEMEARNGEPVTIVASY